jgi:hypothetical protein
MPYIGAIVFTKWAENVPGKVRPDAIDDVFSWALSNGERLPNDPDCGAKFTDLTGQANTHTQILDNLAIFIGDLEITTATAAQFAADPRIWTLGYRRFNDDGEVTFSNWNEPLTVEERQQAGDYVSANSKITKAQLAARFDAEDTRRDVAEKLKEFFRE